MKHFSRAFSAAAAALLLFSSCSGPGQLSLVNLKYEDSQMINKHLDLAYNAAPLTYQPVSIGEPYAYYKKGDLTLYEIVGLNPEEWLTEPFTGGTTTIFYDADITLPTLAEMEPNKALVCSNEEITYAVATLDDPETVGQLVDLFENGEAVEWPLLNSYITYEIKFASEEKYPYLFYNLIYGEFPEGQFLYDRYTKRCVEVGTLLADKLA